jgi:hypothetical protein
MASGSVALPLQNTHHRNFSLFYTRFPSGTKGEVHHSAYRIFLGRPVSLSSSCSTEIGTETKRLAPMSLSWYLFSDAQW